MVFKPIFSLSKNGKREEVERTKTFPSFILFKFSCTLLFVCPEWKKAIFLILFFSK